MKRFIGLLSLTGLLILGLGLVCSTFAFELTVPEAVGLSAERLDRIGAVLNEDIQSGKIAGAVVLVARHGKITYFESFGKSNPEASSTMAKDSIFRIYSMTKPITAVATMILVEEGKLMLSDPVSKYIPSFKEIQVGKVIKDSEGNEEVKLEKAKSVMTVHHLLTHTSGLSYWFFPPKSIQKLYLEAGMKDAKFTIAEMCDKMADLPLLFNPGEKYNYSRSFDVLGRVVEVASGMPFDKFLEEKIFGPLQMKDTGFNVGASNQDRLVYLSPKDPLN